MFKRKANKKTILAAVCAASVLVIGTLAYVFIGSIVEYEVVIPESGEVRVGGTDTGVRVASPEDLPESDGYTLFLENGKLCVYNSRKEKIYCDENTAPDVLSDADIAELEQDGMYFAARSEVIEILGYLKS